VPLNTFLSATVPVPGFAQDPSCWPGAVTTNQCSTPGGGQNGSGGATRLGLAPRNGYRLPKIWNFDMRVSRRIKIDESKALEFFIEGFNLFNRTQVTGEQNQIYSASTVAATCNAAHTACTSPSGVLNYNTAFQSVNAAGGTLFRERQVQWAVRFQF
jgi:hypothetical protein